jgi:hypothetical protein
MIGRSDGTRNFYHFTSSIHTRPGVTYAQIAKRTIPTPLTSDLDPITNPITQPPQQPNDVLDLKLMMKSLFEQLGTMLNLLTTVLAKLP